MTERSCTYYDHRRRACCTECGQPIDLCACEDPDHYAQTRLWTEDGIMIRAIRAELQQARQKFPVPKHMLAAMFEEVGELANALIEHETGNKTAAEIFQEAVQVAVTAIRVATEGDTDFQYEPYAVFARENTMP